MEYPCENGVYSIPVTENCREGSSAALVAFWVFFCIFASISTPVLSQHIQGVKNLLNCASKREGGKIIEKDKNNIFLLLV